MSDNILILKNIDKSFGGIQALNNVSLAVRIGEIHALVGENGAGKSTLIRILTGAINKDSGEIIFDGARQEIENPIKARDLGISAVYQEVNLFPGLPVAYNLLFSREPTKGRLGWLRRNEIREQAEKYLKDFNMDIDVFTPVNQLSLGQKRIIEILKAVSSNARFLIMDEATSGMSRAEIDMVFRIVKDLRTKHITVLYISHHLEEIFEIADRVSVLRDGQFVGTYSVKEIAIPELARAIVGREIKEEMPPRENVLDDTVVLEVQDLWIPKLEESLSFTLRKGEILGITGVIGSGKTEIARALFGVDPIISGKVKIFDKEFTSRLNPQKARNLGLGLIPEDRKTEGLFPLINVGNNIILVDIKRALSGLIFISAQKRRAIAQKAIKSCRIIPDDISLPAENLSGGNQQKVVIAKWLATEPRIMILDEPTRGIDVGAKVEIHKLILDLAQKGVGVLYFSSEFKEVIGLCDRIIVLKKGKIVGIVSREEASLEKILTLALG